jgi:hypothetical protein
MGGQTSKVGEKSMWPAMSLCTGHSITADWRPRLSSASFAKAIRRVVSVKIRITKANVQLQISIRVLL